jgi:hypothetical protein
MSLRDLIGERRRRADEFLRAGTDAELEQLIRLVERGDAPALEEAQRLCDRLRRRSQLNGPPSARERRARRRAERRSARLRERQRAILAEAGQRRPAPPEPEPEPEPVERSNVIRFPRAGGGERLTGREWLSQRTRGTGSVSKSIEDEIW